MRDTARPGRPAQVYLPSLPLIWIHLPKSAGSSVRRIVDGWFGSEHVFPHYKQGRDAPLPSVPAAPGPATVVYGHFNRERGFGVETLPFEASQFVTILREPLEKHVSAFFYLNRAAREQGKQAKTGGDDQAALDRWVADRHLPYLEHFPEPVCEANYRHVVDRFLVVGIYELLHDSMRAIASALGKEFQPSLLAHSNRTERFAYQLDPDAIGSFRQRHRLEHQTYWYALERFARTQRAVHTGAPPSTPRS